MGFVRDACGFLAAPPPAAPRPLRLSRCPLDTDCLRLAVPGSSKSFNKSR